MASGALPVLWLFGPSGVGKSSVGWEIFTQVSQAGTPAGYVDLDQLGLCYPTPAGDPANDGVKAQNLGAVWPGFRKSGARCLVISGSVSTLGLVAAYARGLRGAALTLCRLRAGPDELRRRFLGRDWSPDLAREAAAEAEALDRADFAGLCVDTTGLSVPQVAGLVRARAGGWP